MCSHYQTLKDAELLLKKFGVPNKPAGGIYDELLAGLANEPCVVERDQMTAELLEAPDKLRKGMAPR